MQRGIIGLGMWCVDTTYKIDNLPERGKLEPISNTFQCVGGGPSNVLTDLNSLGFKHPMYAMGSIGLDTDASIIKKHCRENKIETKYLIVSKQISTSHTVCMFEKQKERTFLYYPGANSLLDKKHFKTYAMVGDGECDEGSIWESAMLASKLKLDNIVAIVDRNRLSVTDVIEIDDGSGSLEDKFAACGWDVMTIDGHDFDSIMPSFRKLTNQKKPTVIIADTVKGKGVSFMESGLKWHHSVPTKEEFDLAKKELRGVK